MGVIAPSLASILIFLCIGHARSQSIDQLINAAMQSSQDTGGLNDDDGTVKVEMDMLFSMEDWLEISRLNAEANEGSVPHRQKRKAVRAIRYRWTNNVIPYSLANHFSGGDIQQIRAAMSDWEKYTCLSFRQATNRDSNSIYIYSGGGCSSYVGMQGGQQHVSLAQGCRVKGVIVHELGHAIGFHHEQTRPDRDGHVRILTQNIQRGTEFNFQRYSTAVQHDYGVPYDYTSVMHYGQYAFSANGRPTIQTIDQSKQHLIGNRYGHSFRDIKLANIMYNCAGNCGSKTCPGEGYVGEDCNCYCPGNPITLCDDDGGGGGGGGGEDCTDENANCGSWAAAGECSVNPTYMLKHCKLSCDSCDDDGDGGGGGGGACEDTGQYCEYWSINRFCTNSQHETYMSENCRQSCDLCDGDGGGGGGGGGGSNCHDYNQYCQSWAANRQCHINSAYMSTQCRKSCGLC